MQFYLISSDSVFKKAIVRTFVNATMYPYLAQQYKKKKKEMEKRSYYKLSYISLLLSIALKGLHTNKE
jgi:choline kinase